LSRGADSSGDGEDSPGQPSEGGTVMKKLVATAMVVVFAGLTAPVQGADKPNPTGTWKWEVSFNNRKFEVTLKLKLEGDKLTGVLPGRQGRETKIEDGTFKDGTVSFKVTREREGQKFTSTYSGKVTGDTIKGKIESERNGQKRSRDWEAKRVKE
jgi:hypothetical protein